MKLQHCNKAQIYNLDRELLCEADVVGDVETTATLRFHESRNDILRTEVHIQFLDSAQGLVSCLCRLSDYDETLSPEGNITSTVLCTILSQDQIVQRRQDIKVSVKIETSASFINEQDDLETAAITILDISAGGLFCISQRHWEISQLFAVKLFDTKIPVDIQVLRLQSPHSYDKQFPENDPRHGYGCKFVSLSRAAESALRKFVYQQDLQKKRSVVGTG